MDIETYRDIEIQGHREIGAQRHRDIGSKALRAIVHRGLAFGLNFRQQSLYTEELMDIGKW